MTATRSVSSEGIHISPLNLVVLLATFIFGGALGGFLARFLAPASELALFIGIGIFPAALLIGGFLIEELWFLRFWERQPHWKLEIEDSSATPAEHAERQRAAAFLPLGTVFGLIGGLIIGLLSQRAPLWGTLILFTLAGLGFGGVVYSLVQFSALPRLGHGAEEKAKTQTTHQKHPPHREHEAAASHKRRFDEGRPEF